MEYLTITATAKRIGVSRQTLHSMIKHGKIKTVEIAGHPVISIKIADELKAERAKAKGDTNGQSK